MTRTTLRVLLFGASLALALGTGCSDDSTFFPDAGDGTGGGADTGTGGGGGGGGGGTGDADAGGNPSLDVSVGDDTGSGGGGETDTGGGGGGGTADLDCVGIISCFNESTSQAEQEACLDAGTAEAQEQFFELLTCVQDNCTGIADEDEYVACQQEFCTPEIAACTGQAAPEGDAGCAETIECLLGCGNDEACANTCVANADSQETLNAVSDYAACASEACTSATSIEEFYACAEAECPEEFAACD